MNLKNLNSIDDKVFMFAGSFSHWPSYLSKHTPSELVISLNANVVEELSPTVDYLVVGNKRKKGRAAAIKKLTQLREKGHELNLINEADFFHLVRPDIRNKRFAFAGGFDFCPVQLTSGKAYEPIANIGAEFSETVDEHLDFLVVGDKRAKGKTAAIKAADALRKEQNRPIMLTEHHFLELMACQLDPRNLDFESLIIKLYSEVNPNRLKSALDMLKAGSFRLFSEVNGHELIGVVQSQTGYSTGYSCAIDADGQYDCVDDDLNGCMSQQGRELCKHVLVLALGLVRSGELDASTAHDWLMAASTVRPTAKADQLAVNWLRYKGAMNGEIDWRPTETTPEDYYAF